MKVEGHSQRSLWENPDEPGKIFVIDQRLLPHQFMVASIETHEAAAEAIREMMVRGAPLIGVVGAYGVYLAAFQYPADKSRIQQAAHALLQTRPTAVNLSWAVNAQLALIESSSTDWGNLLLNQARRIAEEDVSNCKKIGEVGLPIIEEIHQRKKTVVNILTHCNAGWLACIDYGTATSPIYAAHDKGIPVHVWVDETRPRNQGASLTAWELSQHGVPHTVISDNTGGHLMQHGRVDLVITGSDRTTRTGDVANKIGTYLKALAAFDNGIPFYVALPSSSIDWNIRDGILEIPIEERSEEEVTHIGGWEDGKIRNVRLTPENSKALNIGFDVTPARLITGIITERGISDASEKGLLSMYPEFV